MKISNLQKKVQKQRARRVLKVRRPILANRERPRLSVFRSNEFIYAQIIDDQKRITIAASSDVSIKEKLTKTEKAKIVGKTVAELALKKKVKKVVFDRNWYKFHGRVKALADAAREAGLLF